MIETTLALSLALGAMNAPLATTAQLKTVSQVPPAQANGPTANPAHWQKLVDAARRGERKAIPGTSYYLYSIFPEADQPPYYFRYIVNITANHLPDGRVEILKGLITSTVFQVDRETGMLTGDSRIFATDGNGKLLSATKMVQAGKMGSGSKPIMGPEVALDITLPVIAAEFAYLIVRIVE